MKTRLNHQQKIHLNMLLKRVQSVYNKARHQCDEDKNDAKDGRTIMVSRQVQRGYGTVFNSHSECVARM